AALRARHHGMRAADRPALGLPAGHGPCAVGGRLGAMPAQPERKFTLPVMQEIFTNHELLHREVARPRLDESGGGVRTVGIVGGGTAGWLTALALREQIPALDVTVIESSSIPVIGVGEASVPSLVSFLHHYLKLDILEFTREVQPTWKQG